MSFQRARHVIAGVVASFLAGGPAMAEDLVFKLQNTADSNVLVVNLSPVGTDDWEENIISGAFLAPNHEVDVHVRDGRDVCEYDIRVIFEDGSTVEDEGVDLCELDTYTVE
ncbi:MAG TPA: hypothetical protein PLJ34_08280 [Hyphomicrobiales bacterium]|nr:hypothetical protein [Kaistiaceae bacterium]HQF31430.1 hypothetical protein [Hyphomicrobiales bacterium]